MQIIKHKTNIDFIGKRKPALFISSVLNLAILVGIAIFGFNFGVDFAGGTVVELKFDHPIRADVQNGLINFRSAQKVDVDKVKQAVAGTGTGVKEVRDLGPAQGGGQDYQ